MKIQRTSVLLAFVIACVVAGPASAGGSVVSYVEPKNQTNPPPAVALNAFDQFQISPISMDAPYAGQPANEDAKQRLQANLDLRVQPLLAQWNAQGSRHQPPRVLKIEPDIRHIKFVSGAVRFWAGGMAGGSAELLTVKLTDAGTGEVIAEPEFYQHADKRAAGWSFGAADKAALIRLSSMITDYLRKNYDAPVGGSTSVATDVKF